MRPISLALLSLALVPLTTAASPAMAQMGGMGGMGGDQGGGGRGGGMGRHGGGHDEERGGPPASARPREMKPIPPKTFDKAVESMFRIADANKDGIVTLAEFDGVITARRNGVIHARFQSIDTNHDGRIDEAEFIAWQSRKGSAAMADEPAREYEEIVPNSIEPDLGTGERDYALLIAVEALNPVVISKANTNYDSGLSLEELLAYEHARFTKADTDQDGFLSAREIEAMRPARRPMGGMMPMGRN